MSGLTRHRPNLEAARECIKQALEAHDRGDMEHVDQCTWATIQYIKPEGDSK